MSYSYPTTMYESSLAQKYVFLVLFTMFAFYHENCAIKAKMEKSIFLPEICTFERNTFIYCSRITVVRVHVNVFL